MCHNLDLLPVPIVAENSILVCGTAFWVNMDTREKYICVVNVGGNMELKLKDIEHQEGHKKMIKIYKELRGRCSKSI